MHFEKETQIISWIDLKTIFIKISIKNSCVFMPKLS